MPRKTKGDSTKGGPSEAPSDTPAADTLTDSQRIAAGVLASCGYVKGRRERNGAAMLAASKAGVSRPTIYVWLENPAFVEAIEQEKVEARFEAWEGLKKSARMGSVEACREILARLDWEDEPKVLIERMKHEHAKEILELKNRLGMPLDDEPVTYNITIEEAGEPPPPDERH